MVSFFFTMRLFHPGAVLTFTAIVQFALASKDDMPCVQGCGT